MRLIYEPSGLLVRQQGDDYRDRVRCNLPFGIGEIVRSFEHQLLQQVHRLELCRRVLTVNWSANQGIDCEFEETPGCVLCPRPLLARECTQVCTFVFPERKDDGIQGETPNDVGYWNFHGPVHLSGSSRLSHRDSGALPHTCAPSSLFSGPWIESLAARTPKKTPRCLRTEPAAAIASTGHG